MKMALPDKTKETDTKDTKDTKEKKYKTIYADEVWDSELQIIKKPWVKIHPQLLYICHAIQKTIGNKEFSILAKGAWGKGAYYVGKDYYVPKQLIGYSSVKYTEDLGAVRAERGFNVVIHSHPFSSQDFSATDEDHINAHFDCSLLFSKDNFTRANLSLTMGEQRLLLDADITIFYEVTSETIDISNIEEDTYNYTKSYYGKGGGASRWEGGKWVYDNPDEYGNYPGFNHLEDKRGTSIPPGENPDFFRGGEQGSGQGNLAVQDTGQESIPPKDKPDKGKQEETEEEAYQRVLDSLENGGSAIGGEGPCWDDYGYSG